MPTDGVDDVEISRSGMTRIELQKLENTIIKKLKENRKNLKISFIGRVSTGKSSIINSILGIDLLPASCGQTTIYSIFISGITDNIFQLKEEDGVWKTFESIDQVKDYLLKIQNENISKIQINLPINKYKILEKCTLIDNPAIGYSDKLDEYVLDQCYRSCDLYVLVIDAVARLWTTEKRFLSKLNKETQISEIKVLFNFTDCIKESELPIVLTHHGKSIKEVFHESGETFIFSGYAFTENKTREIMEIKNCYNSEQDLKTPNENLFEPGMFIKNSKVIEFLQTIPSNKEIEKTSERLKYLQIKNEEKVRNINENKNCYNSCDHSPEMYKNDGYFSSNIFKQDLIFTINHFDIPIIRGRTLDKLVVKKLYVKQRASTLPTMPTSTSDKKSNNYGNTIWYK